jgi:CRP/FNR family transcriptional regulator, cyclic AMP receptor protein
MRSRSNQGRYCGMALCEVALFRQLPIGIVQRLSRQCSWRVCAPDQQILGLNDLSREVFFIVKGRVRVSYFSASGRELIFGERSAGDLFGELSAIDGQPRSASVRSVSETLLAVMTSANFLSMLEQHSQIASALLIRLAATIRSLTERVAEVSTLPVRNRVHAELLRLAGKGIPGGKWVSIVPAPKHAEIAAKISTHRETVTRELNELVRLGLLEKRPGMLLVRHTRGLMPHDLG